MDEFLRKYTLDYPVHPPPLTVDVFGGDDVAGFLGRFAGASFNSGIYRVHDSDDIEIWTSVVHACFPRLRGNTTCFAFDWLGRQFVTVAGDAPRILMVDIDTGEVLEIPVGFREFHEIELVRFANDALAKDEFDIWLETQVSPLGHSECVSYTVPLHMGGKDDLSNRERKDMRVHWELGAQILDQIEPLKVGQRITEITLIE